MSQQIVLTVELITGICKMLTS